MKSVSLFLKHTLGVLLLATIITACKKETNVQDEGKETITSNFGNIAYFANASALAKKGNSSTKPNMAETLVNSVAVNWSSASVWVEKIAFVGKNGTLLDTTIKVAKNINIFNSETLVGIIKLPAGAYKDISVKLFCRKSPKSEFSFDFKGTFISTQGKLDSVRVGSSYPFEADLKTNDIVINTSDNYKATFHFDLTKVLTGISNYSIESTSRKWNNDRSYMIWKGGSKDEPFYDQIIRNWQNVASIVVVKESANPVWTK